MKHLILLLIPLLMVSCSSREAPNKPAGRDKVATSEAVSEVYVYGQAKTLQKSLEMMIGADPVAISCGYIKLAGTINGDAPLALIEIAGRGNIYRIGEAVGEYRVNVIDERKVKLCLRK